VNCDEHRKLSENAGSAAVGGMLRSMETLRQDLRHAARVLWRAKAFTVAAVITLALGIAGTTVMFTLIQGVLLRPLPVHEQDRLILAWKETRASGSARYPFGNTEIESVAAASRLLEHAAGVTRNGVSRTVVTENGVSSYANVGLVTGGFFDVLGVKPIAGRTLAPSDDRDGAEPVIVVSSGFWQRRFGGARDVIDRQISLNERPLRIVGVMPPDLDYPTGVEIWQPTTSVPTGAPFGMAARREVNLIGRMRAGVTVEQAASEIASLNERLAAEPAMRNLVPVVRSFPDLIVGDVRTAMLALSAAVGLVLLIASANVANLLLMRGEGRRAELALRVALGAGRARIVRQILAESLVLAVLAGVAGFAIAWFSLPLLIRLVPDGLTRVESIRVDQTVLMFALVVVLVTALLAGLAPGLLAVRADLVAALRGGASAITGRVATRGRRALVVAQVALAVIVLAAAGLLVRTMLNLQSIDLGLRAERLVLLDLHTPLAKYRDRQQHAQFLDAAIAQLESVPAIVAATPVNVSPFSDRGWDVPRITAEGQSADESAANPSLNLESIHPNYFVTVEAPIVRGRAFTAADHRDAVPVAIVSDDLAAWLWARENPIGKRLKMGPVGGSGRWLEVVGVAASTRYRTVTTARPTLYLPAAQFQMTASMMIVRTTAPLELVTSLANDRIRTADPDARVMRVAPFTELLARPLARPRFTAFLLSVFAAVALLLASVGLYAVIAASVRQRDREIALRLALGATAGAVRRLILSEAIVLAALGAVIGVAGAAAMARFLSGLLFGVDPLDPVTIGAAALALVAAATLASYGPVRRAPRADLIATLRSQ
jgi:putative ABC transport system permease protein